MTNDELHQASLVDPRLQLWRQIDDWPVDFLEVVAIRAAPLECVTQRGLRGPGDATDLLDRLEPHRFATHRAILSFGHTRLLPGAIGTHPTRLDNRRSRSPHYACAARHLQTCTTTTALPRSRTPRTARRRAPCRHGRSSRMRCRRPR